MRQQKKNSTWQIRVDAPAQSITGTTLLAVDVDPRVPALNLGLRIRTGGEPALWNGAMIRLFLTVESVTWAPLAGWLAEEEAAALLARVEAGYTGTRLWSGDWTGQWSEDALAALEALHDGLNDRAHQGAPSAVSSDSG